MQAFVLALILVALTGDYLAAEGWVPRVVPFLQEIIAALVAAYVVMAGAANRWRYVHPGYWIALAGLALIWVCGIVVNGVDAGPIFAGVRTHARALPLFFVAAVWLVTERRLKAQLVLILLLALLQLPIALDQRMTTFQQAYLSGDRTVGTIMSSGGLSIFLICVSCVLTGFFLRRRLRWWLFVPLFLLVLTPTMLNETKATLVLLPIGLITTFVAGSAPGRRLRNGVLAVFLLGVFGAIFVPVYDYFMKPRWGYGIMDFFTMEGRLEGYLDKDAQVGSREAGRIDSIKVPVVELARDPATLAFGYGIGNASESALGEQFTGHYFRRFEPFALSAATEYLLEIGVFGLSIILLIWAFVFRDTRRVLRSSEGLMEAFSVGWCGVMATMVLGAFYNDAVLNGSLGFLFWYFSGVMAAERMRLALDVPVPARHHAPLVRRHVRAAG